MTEMSQLNHQQVLDSLHSLRGSYDAALVSYWTRDEYHKNELERHFKEAAAALGFNLVEKERPATAFNNTEVRTATAMQVTNTPSTAGGIPQNVPSALQDIDCSRDDYSRGLSGRASS